MKPYWAILWMKSRRWGLTFCQPSIIPTPATLCCCQAHQRRKDTSGQVFEQEYKLCCKDGSTRTGLSRELVLTRNADGTAAQILGIALDISDHKRAEAERWANVSDAARVAPVRRYL